MTPLGPRILTGAKFLPREALQALLDTWESRARSLILAMSPEIDLDATDLKVAEIVAMEAGNPALARGLHWYAHLLVAREEYSLEKPEAVKDPEFALDFFRNRARVVRAVAGELTGGLDGPGEADEYQRQLLEIELARKHWRA